MDSFELNKIIGAILGTLLFVMGAGFLAEAIYAPKQGIGPGYDLPEPEGEASTGPVEIVRIDIGTLLASANVEQGEIAARKCSGCHNFAEGAGNKQGPELYAVVGRPIAGHAGFTYSEALLAHAAEGWTYENLDHFLEAPGQFAPRTKMNFGGLKDERERANVIAYLASITPSAPAFPAPAQAEDADDPLAPSGDEPVATDANAIETPTTTSTETVVEGTPAPEAPAPVVEAPATVAPEAAPATTPAPATQAPVTTEVPAAPAQ